MKKTEIMSQGFKLKFDQMKESDPTKVEAASDQPAKAHEQYYPDDGHVRNLCLNWLSGKRIFMNYGYLVSAEYSPEENSITLAFTTQTYILSGINLEDLYYEIFYQRVKQIACTDKRYNIIGGNEKSIVNEIELSTQK